MDPNEVWIDINDAFSRLQDLCARPIKVRDLGTIEALYESTIDDLENLAAWMRKGGFAPTPIPAKER